MPNNTKSTTKLSYITELAEISKRHNTHNLTIERYLKMKEKELADLTDEELQKKWKDDKFPHQITVAALIMSILLTILRAFVSGFSFSLLYAPAFIAIITIVLWVNYNSVQKEMKARNLGD